MQLVKLKPGDWFNAKAVEDAVTDLNEAAGNLGYAFADINPAYDRDAEKRLMNITFKVGETPRVYVERIDITGNTSTRDKVIRREFRLNEGDAFNALKVKRSQDRIQSLGFFQEKLEIKQTEGSAPDRVVLGVNVEEKPTGQLSLSGGYSSLERFVIQLAVSQNNFMGKGQQLDASRQLVALFEVGPSSASPIRISWTSRSCSAASCSGATTAASTIVGNRRNTTYSQVSTGGGLRIGFPLTEYWSFGGRYTSGQGQDLARQEHILHDRRTAILCDPLKAGRYLCDEIGSRLTSLVRLFDACTTIPTAFTRPAVSV